MEKTISFFNELGMAAYSAIILCAGYSIRWFLLKLKSLIVQDVWQKVDDRIETQMKPITDLAKENSSELKLLKTKQDDIFTKLRETKHEIKANTESSINHQVLDSLERLQDFINKSNKNDK